MDHFRQHFNYSNYLLNHDTNTTPNVIIIRYDCNFIVLNDNDNFVVIVIKVIVISVIDGYKIITRSHIATTTIIIVVVVIAKSYHVSNYF